jgi:hypothetical protein
MASFAVAAPLESDLGAEPLSALWVRDLTSADLDTINAGAKALEVLAPRPTLKELRFSHHQLARLIAIGETPMRISLITGYAPGYIRSIQLDPTFAALVDHYSDARNEIMVDIKARMRDLGLDSLLILQKRLHEEQEAPGSQKFSHRELLEVIDTLLVKPNVAASSQGSGTAPVNVQISFVKASTPDASNVIEGELMPASNN